MQKAAAHFIERIGQRPIALGSLRRQPPMLTTFDDERQTVLARLAALGAADAWRQPAAARRSARRRRRFAPPAPCSPASSSCRPRRPTPAATPADALIAPVIDSNAMLHVIANRPGQTAAGGQRSNPTLRALAEQSRGEFTVIYSAASYQAALDRLADRLTSEMMIEYLVPVGSKPNDVKVGVRIVGARVRGLGVAPR